MTHTLVVLLIALSWLPSYGAKTITYDDDAQSYKVPEKEISAHRDMLCKKFQEHNNLSWTELSLYYTCKALLNNKIEKQKRKLLEHTFSSLRCHPKILLPVDKIFSKADECEYQALKTSFTLFDQDALDTQPETYVSVCLLKACIDAPKYSPEYFWLKNIYTPLTCLIPAPFNATTTETVDDETETMFQFDEEV